MNSSEVFDRLSPKSLSLFEKINPGFDNIKELQIGKIIDNISQIEPRFIEISKEIGFTTKSRYKVKLADWLITAYYEANLVNSDKVDVHHLYFALLLKIDPDKYFIAKKSYIASYEAQLDKGLSNYIEDLNTIALESKKPFIGKERELTKLIVSLTSDKETPVLLLGNSGVGKTALMTELARRIEKMQVPLDLIGAKVVRVKFPALLSVIPNEPGSFPGDYLSRLLANIVEKEKKAKNVILFVDDLRLGVNFFLGSPEKNKNVSIVAAAQNDMNEKFWDSAFARHWNIIPVEDLSNSELRQILRGEAKHIEDTQGVKFSDNSLEKIIYLYRSGAIEDSFPGYGIKLLNSLVTYKIHYLSNYDLFADLINNFDQIKSDDALKERIKEAIPTVITIEEADVLGFLGSDDGAGYDNEGLENRLSREKIEMLEESLADKIIGQDKALQTLSKSLRVSALKLHFETRPMGVFLLLGPTGVGKTETAKILAKYLYGTRDRNQQYPKSFMRVDMTEYSEKHAVSKLFGPPPGYVGYDDASSLADFVQENPYSVVLFDEIDKAHPDVLNSLLHIMDEAEIRTNSGEFVSFENVIILMTSNHGLELLSKFNIGFAKNKTYTDSEIEEILSTNLKRNLKAEFLNRFDEIIIFRQLDHEAIIKISEKIFEPIKKNLATTGIELVVRKTAIKTLSEKANVSEYGARDIKRVIKREVLDEIAKKLLIKDANISKIIVSSVSKKLNISFN
jgi:ATP-dependent Clp protease ATP-binding subunit ClpC